MCILNVTHIKSIHIYPFQTLGSIEEILGSSISTTVKRNSNNNNNNILSYLTRIAYFDIYVYIQDQDRLFQIV